MKLNFFYYLKRSFELGIKNSFSRAVDTIFKKIQLVQDRYVNSKKQELFSQNTIKFYFFLSKLNKFNNFLGAIKKDGVFGLEICPQKNVLNNYFQKLRNNKFSVFNSFFKITKKNFNFWHQDWLLGNQNEFYKKDNMPFFEDLKINNFSHKNKSSFGPEVKSVWEVARLQNFTNLALFSNLESTTKKKRELSLSIINKYISSLISNSKYLHGHLWSNPMEVAIRAINICLIFSFWQPKKTNLIARNIAFLEQHEKFIQNYLETSATPNNHYLADLLGLCFLAVFLKKSKSELVKIFIKTEKAFLHQLNKDGSFYEGSSTYHKLNVEMVLYFLLLAKFAKIKIKNHLQLKNGIKLVSACTMPNFFLRIGDDDSGKIVFGLDIKIKKEKQSVLKIEKFLDFGLIVVKNENNLLSFRNFNIDPQSQPLGHFNLDQLSINLIVNGEPILISSGTGAYTSNINLRNHFRSSSAHNNFGLKNEDAIFIKDPTNLFFLNLKKQKQNSFFVKNKVKNKTQIITLIGINYDLFSFGYIKERKIKIFYNLESQKLDRILLEDKINFTDSCVEFKKEPVCWRLIFYKSLRVKKISKNKQIVYGKKNIILIKSSIPLEKKRGVVSKNYLQAESSKILFGKILIKKSLYLCTELIF